jgi:hypothetical protein
MSKDSRNRILRFGANQAFEPVPTKTFPARAGKIAVSDTVDAPDNGF